MDGFKFELAWGNFQHNHLRYVVGVETDHTVWWRVLSPEAGRVVRYLKIEDRLARDVDSDPAGSIEWAHKSAQAWIDNYVETHLALQRAIEGAQTERGEEGVTRLSEEREDAKEDHKIGR